MPCVHRHALICKYHLCVCFYQFQGIKVIYVLQCTAEHIHAVFLVGRLAGPALGGWSSPPNLNLGAPNIQ